MKVFNNPDVLPSSWYAVLPSSAVKRGQVKKTTLLDRPIAIFRGENNEVYAVDGRCPHLGADLSRGCVIGNNLQCEFHHWVFNGQGQCEKIPSQKFIPPSAKTFAYPVQERYGFIWLYNGPKPAFPIPFFEQWDHAQLKAFRLPQIVFKCHSHIAACNGLDIEHMRSLHNMKFIEEPVLTQLDFYRIQVKYNMAFGGKSVMDKIVRACLGESFILNFTTWGGNMAMGEVAHKHFPILMIFNHVPHSGGGTKCNSFFFLPKEKSFFGEPNYFKLPFLLLIMNHFLVADMDLFNTIRFWPRLIEKDEPLRLFIQQVNQMPCFNTIDGAQRAPLSINPEQTPDLKPWVRRTG